MAWFFTEKNIFGNNYTLVGENAKHISKVLRMRTGDAVAQREPGQAAADDEPADDALQQRIAQAHGQRQKPLPEGELAQCSGDLGPVLPENEHHDAGQQGQNAQ